MRVLITGITGFAGGHLARLLVSHGHEVVGLARSASWNDAAVDVAPRVPLHVVDLCTERQVEMILREVQPEHVYHLAGYAEVGRSFKEPDATWAGNLTATRSFYDALARWSGRPRVLHVSSGAIYGEPDTPGERIDEKTALRPNSPYAASKAAGDLLACQYFRTHDLPIIRARPFNHIGPGQSAGYAVANFARQIAAIERGLQPPVLKTGNLRAARDLTDVRDVVEAYRLLLEKGEPGQVYNVASGRSRTMQSYLDLLLTLTEARLRVQADSDLARRVETNAVRVDTSLLRRTTGWTPEVSLEQSLRDVMEYWRTREEQQLRCAG